MKLKFLLLIGFFAQTSTFISAQQELPKQARNLFCNSLSGLAKAWFQKGNDAFSQAKFDDAVLFFQKSIVADSNFCDPWHGLSILYANSNKLDSAEFCSRKAYSVNQSEKLTYNLATTLGMRNKYDEAIPLLATLSKTEYKKAEVLQSLAQMYLYEEKYDDAIANAEASLKLCEENDPDLAGINYLLLGSAWLWQQKPEKARAFLLKSIELGVRVPDSYLKAAGL
jgi:tetratricopeptide (TPR) repeat protein